MTDTGSELHDIMSGDIADDVADTSPPETTEAAEDGVNRDEKGRFAAKAETQPEQQDDVADTPEERPEQGKVPLAAVTEARNRERSAKEEAEALRRELAEIRGQLTAFAQQRQPASEQPKPQQDETPVIWEDPEKFTDARVTAAMTPIQKQMAEMNFNFSKFQAISTYGAEKVAEAETSMLEAIKAGKLDGDAVRQQITQSRDPVGDVVKWHLKAKTLETVGNDPNAWLEAEIEKRMADPAFQAKMLERTQATAAANTSRSAPVTKLPPSLSRMPAGGNAPADLDMSDAGLFRSAMR